VTRLCPQQDHDLFEGVLSLIFLGQSGLGDEGNVLEIGDDLPGQRLRRGDNVGQPGVNGASGHALEFGRGRLLHEDRPRFLLDGFEAHCTVGAHP